MRVRPWTVMVELLASSGMWRWRLYEHGVQVATGIESDRTRARVAGTAEAQRRYARKAA